MTEPNKNATQLICPKEGPQDFKNYCLMVQRSPPTKLMLSGGMLDPKESKKIIYQSCPQSSIQVTLPAKPLSKDELPEFGVCEGDVIQQRDNPTFVSSARTGAIKTSKFVSRSPRVESEKKSDPFGVFENYWQSSKRSCEANTIIDVEPVVAAKQPQQEDKQLGQAELRLQESLQKRKNRPPTSVIDQILSPSDQEDTSARPRCYHSFISVHQIPTTEFLASMAHLTRGDQKRFATALRPLLKKYDLVYDNEAFRTNFSYTSIATHLERAKVSPNVKQLPFEFAWPDLSAEVRQETFFDDLMTTLPARPPHRFQDRVFVRNFLWEQRLDDQSLEAIMSVFTTACQYLFFVPPNAYNSARIMERIQEDFACFRTKFMYLRAKATLDMDATLSRKATVSNQLDQKAGESSKDGTAAGPGLFQPRYLIFSPFCTEEHWVAFLYEQDSDFYYRFDSLGWEVPDSFMEQFETVLKKNFLNQGIRRRLSMKTISITRQNNVYDCGFCMLLTLIKIIEQGVIPKRVTYRVEEVEKLRRFFTYYFLLWSQFVEAPEPPVIEIQEQDDGIVDID